MVLLHMEIKIIQKLSDHFCDNFTTYLKLNCAMYEKNYMPHIQRRSRSRLAESFAFSDDSHQ